MKRILVSWQVARKQAIRVEKDDMTLRINNEIICSVSTVDNTLKIKWIKAWEDWREMHEDEEFKKLVISCKSKLAQMGSIKGKGKAASE